MLISYCCRACMGLHLGYFVHISLSSCTQSTFCSSWLSQYAPFCPHLFSPFVCPKVNAELTLQSARTVPVTETIGRESARFNLYTRPTDEPPATEVGWATVINKSLLLLVWQVRKLVIAPAFYYAALCECLTRALICTRTTFVSSFFSPDKQVILLCSIQEKICSHPLKTWGMQCAASICSLTAVFQKGLGYQICRCLEEVFNLV